MPDAKNTNLLEQFLKAIQYRITGGSEFGWECYGPNSHHLDHDVGYGGRYSMSLIFDRVNQTAYEMNFVDEEKTLAYRWINPEFRDAYVAEAKRRNVNECEAYEGCDFTDVEIPEDVLEKITCVMRGEEYDPRVTISIELPDSGIYELMKMAHARDITLNQLMVEILEKYIED